MRSVRIHMISWWFWKFTHSIFPRNVSENVSDSTREILDAPDDGFKRNLNAPKTSSRGNLDLEDSQRRRNSTWERVPVAESQRDTQVCSQSEFWWFCSPQSMLSMCLFSRRTYDSVATNCDIGVKALSKYFNFQFTIYFRNILQEVTIGLDFQSSSTMPLAKLRWGGIRTCNYRECRVSEHAFSAAVVITVMRRIAIKCRDKCSTLCYASIGIPIMLCECCYPQCRAGIVVPNVVHALVCMHRRGGLGLPKKHWGWKSTN